MIKNTALKVSTLAGLMFIGLGSYSVAHSTAVKGVSDAKAEQPYEQHMKKQGRYLDHLAKRLELSDEQQVEIKAQMSASREVSRPYRKEIGQLRAELSGLVRDNASEAELAAVTEKLGDLMGQQVLQKAQARQRIAAILTPEQQDAFHQMKRKHRNKVKRHMASSTVY